MGGEESGLAGSFPGQKALKRAPSVFFYIKHQIQTSKVRILFFVARESKGFGGTPTRVGVGSRAKMLGLVLE